MRGALCCASHEHKPEPKSLRMKIPLNKKTLADMPQEVRSVVSEWQTRSRKRFISVTDATHFYSPEDAHVTLINLAAGVSQSARVAGSWAGTTPFRPNERVPLPRGVVAVVTGFFLGVAYCEIYQGTAETAGALPGSTQKLN